MVHIIINVNDSNALALLGDAPSPVRVVVFNNDGGGIFEHLPQAGQVAREEFEALWGTPIGLDVARLAAVWGVPYRRMERLADLDPASVGETQLVEVPLKRRRDVELRRRLMTAAGAAVERATTTKEPR